MTIDLAEIAARESEQVEWKEEVADWHDVVRTLVAFANDLAGLGGGYVVCGAAERQDAHGWPRVEMVGLTSARFKEIEGKVLSACNQQVEPPIHPLVDELPTADSERRVLIFTVTGSSEAHQYRAGPQEGGIYWIRQGSRTIAARNGGLRHLLTRKGLRRPWDKSPHPRATVADIDALALRDVLQRIGYWDPARSVEAVLSARLSALAPRLAEVEPLTGTVRPHNAALLMFAAVPQYLIGSAVVVFSIYPGTDRGEPYAERHEMTGSIFEQERRIRELLNTQNYGVIDKTHPDANIQKYPEKALREAVINALVHRDYEDREPIRITVFYDRIEILSPGSLPPGADAEAFMRGESPARWRNHSLAFFCNRLKLAQAEGQGIPTIMLSMKDGGCPAPIFRVGELSVTCVLPAHPRHGLMRALMDAERALLMRDFETAEQRLLPLLTADPYNYRTLGLFCDLCVLSGQPEKLWELIESLRLDVTRLNAATQIAVAEVLASATGSENEAMVATIDRLFELASAGHLQEAHAQRLVASERRRGKHQQAIELLDRLWTQNPALRESPLLIRHRGEALIDLAKGCGAIIRSKTASPEVKSRARDEQRGLLVQAERDLTRALQQAKTTADREGARRGLEFISKLRGRHGG